MPLTNTTKTMSRRRLCWGTSVGFGCALLHAGSSPGPSIMPTVTVAHAPGDATAGCSPGSDTSLFVGKGGKAGSRLAVDVALVASSPLLCSLQVRMQVEVSCCVLRCRPATIIIRPAQSCSGRQRSKERSMVINSHPPLSLAAALPRLQLIISHSRTAAAMTSSWMRTLPRMSARAASRWERLVARHAME